MGREAAAETGFLFSSWLPPSRRSCGRPRRELGAGRPPQPGPVRPGDRRAPAGRLALPSPRRSSADDPRPGRTSSRAAPRTRGPARGLLPGPRGRAEETRGRSGTILAESARARRGSRPPPESPRMRDLWGGVRLEGAKMALGLARRQDWWRSCSAGAIFPGGAGGALRGRFAGRGAGRSGATGSCAQGVGFCKWGRGRAAEPASPRSLGLPQAPRPKGRAGRLRAGRARGGGAFLRSSCVCGKKWAGGRALQLVGSLSEPASPFGQNWR